MTEIEIRDIKIIPAKFLEKKENGYICKCYIDENHTEDRLFDSYSLDKMINPKYLLIGIITGVGVMQINFIDANEFENIFNEKWKTLTK